MQKSLDDLGVTPMWIRVRAQVADIAVGPRVWNTILERHPNAALARRIADSPG